MIAPKSKRPYTKRTLKIAKVLSAKKADGSKATNDTLIQYIKKGGQTRGVLAAVAVGDYFCVGYSLVNRAAGDRFDKKRGVAQAVTRAKRSLKSVEEHMSDDVPAYVVVPPSIFKSMEFFAARAQKYFKDKKVLYTIKKWDKDTLISTNGPALTEAEAAELAVIFGPDMMDALTRTVERGGAVKLPQSIIELVEKNKIKNLKQY